MQRLYQRLHNIQNDYQNKIVSNVVRTKPQWVSIDNIEDRDINASLNIRDTENFELAC